MKNLIITSLLLSSLTYGQFFETPQENVQSENLESETNEEEYYAPEQGLDEDNGPGTPGEVPINQWALLLPLAGLAVGGYRLWRMKQERI